MSGRFEETLYVYFYRATSVNWPATHSENVAQMVDDEVEALIAKYGNTGAVPTDKLREALGRKKQ